MKYTLSDCIESINQILNYPAVSYIDISHFFDQAISEINTELRLGLRPFSEIYRNSGFKIESLTHYVNLDETPKTEIPTEKGTNTVWFDKTEGLIHYMRGTKEHTCKTLYGVQRYFDGKNVGQSLYRTVTLTDNAYWTPYEYVPEREFNILDYMPYDWVVLFLIPYVCFKYSVRDGSSGALFSDDFQQGFQQLRNSYDIPCFVNLQEQAGLKAYQEDVKARLPKLDIIIPTRAIYDSMKVSSVILAENGGLFDKGGWGL